MIGTGGISLRAAATRAAAGLLLAATAAVGLAEAAGVSTPIVSGLGWRSGAKLGDCLASLRGRALDANSIFLTDNSFAAMVTQSGGNWARTEAKDAPLWVVSVPLLTEDTAGQFQQCAAGAFDSSFRQVGANLARAAAAGTVVRLGWEANIGSDNHPWGVDAAAQIPAYKACWRRAAQAIKAGFPAVSMEWTSSKKTANTAFRATDLYPGDDVVDVWGVHYYNTGPQKTTQAIWDKYYNITFNGGPWGLGTWLAAAKASGKRLAVSEYGLWQQDGMTEAGADNPVYVDNMYRFFRDNAADIAYEAYHNSIDDHALCPSQAFPNSAAAYKADWGAGK